MIRCRATVGRQHGSEVARSMSAGMGKSNNFYLGLQRILAVKKMRCSQPSVWNFEIHRESMQNHLDRERWRATVTWEKQLVPR